MALLQGYETRIEYILPRYAIPVGVAACVVTSVAAAALAARQVYKVQPVEALAPVGTSTADAVALRARVVAGVFGVGFDGNGDRGRLPRSWPCLGGSDCADGARPDRAVLRLRGPDRRAAAACARAFGAPGALAAATIERAPRRVWATLMTVMIAVSITVHSTGSNANAIDSTNASFASLGDVDFFVSSSGPGVFPTAPMLPQDTESVDRVDPREYADVVPGQMAYATLGGTRVIIQGLAPGSVAPPSGAMNAEVLATGSRR